MEWKEVIGEYLNWLRGLLKVKLLTGDSEVAVTEDADIFTGVSLSDAVEPSVQVCQ